MGVGVQGGGGGGNHSNGEKNEVCMYVCVTGICSQKYLNALIVLSKLIICLQVSQ